MKLRRGFVSNSSTTSFCIYGICIDDYDMLQKAADIAKIKCDTKSDDFDSYEIGEIGEQIADKHGLEYHSGPEGEGMYFGKSLSNMKDDETYGEFKKNIAAELLKIFGEKMDCGVIEEAWRDG